MEVLRQRRPSYDVVIGPCPGCGLWQLDYTYEVAKQWIEVQVEAVYEAGDDVPVDLIHWIDRSGFNNVVEDIFAEHLDECPHLQRLMIED